MIMYARFVVQCDNEICGELTLIDEVDVTGDFEAEIARRLDIDDNWKTVYKSGVLLHFCENCSQEDKTP